MPGPLDRIRSALARRIMPSAEREALFPPPQVERPTALAPVRPEPEPPQSLMPELDLGSGNMENAIEALRNAPMDRRGLMNMLRGASAAATVGRIAPLAAQAVPVVAEAVTPAVQTAAPAAPSVMSLMTDLMRSPFSYYPRVNEIEKTLYDENNGLSRQEYRNLDLEGARLQDEYRGTQASLHRIHGWANDIARARATLQRAQLDDPDAKPDPYDVRMADSAAHVRARLSARGNFEMPPALIDAIYRSGLPVDKFITQYIDGVLETLPLGEDVRHMGAMLESLEEMGSDGGGNERATLLREGQRGAYLGRIMFSAAQAAGGVDNVTPELFMEHLGLRAPHVRSMLPEDYVINPEAWQRYIDLQKRGGMR